LTSRIIHPSGSIKMARKGPKKNHCSRNHDLVRGVSRYSRSVSYHRTGKWAIKNKKPVEAKKVEKKEPKIKAFGKDGKEKREIKRKTPRFYPTEDEPKKLPSRKHNHHPTRLRPSLQPGSIVIVLAGRFRGKRVVFLKQLPSGLLLVTGPFKINGVPLRRLNQRYVIATSTKLDISDVKLDPKFNDDYFKRPQKEKKKKTEGEFFAAEAEKKKIDVSRVDDQKAFDKPLLEIVKKKENIHLREYLGSKFSLKRNQYPHDMKF